MRPLLFVVAFLVTLGESRPTPAAGTPAEAALERGVDLMHRGQYKDALAEFLRADQMSPSARTEAQIALAEQALGAWARAEALLSEALQSAGDAWIAAHRGILEAALRKIGEHVGEIIVEVKPPFTGVLKVNGEIRSIGKAIRVDEGDAVIDVEADGHERAVRHVMIKAGSTAREAIVLVPVVPPAAAAPPTLLDQSAGKERQKTKGISRSRILGAGLLLVGIVGVGVGAYLLALDGTDACDGSVPFCPRVYSTRLQGGITLGISAAGATLGAILLDR